MENHLAEMRKRHKLTQEQLGLLLENTTQTNVSNWERGITTPNLATALRIAKLFSCTIEDLFELKG